MGTRIKTFDSTGVAPNGKLFAGDLNAIEDQYADAFNLLQAFGAASVTLGESGLQIIRFGSGEARLTGAFRTDGIIRALGGLYFGAFTTAQRDAISIANAPYGLVILNTTTNRLEINLNSSGGAPSWQPLSGSNVTFGSFSAIPAPSLTNTNTFYFAIDQNGGTLYFSNGSSWTKIAPGLTEPKIPIDGSVSTVKLADGAVTQVKSAPGAFAGTSYGTAFPTTGLYTGYRFTLVLSQPTGGFVTQDFIYRDDLDATLPWFPLGDRNVTVASDAGTSTSSTAFIDWLSFTTPRQGNYEFRFSGRFSNSTNQNAPSGIARLLIAGSEVRRIQGFSGTSEPPTHYALRYFASNVGAGATIKIQIAISVSDVGQSTTIDQADFTYTLRRCV